MKKKMIFHFSWLWRKICVIPLEMKLLTALMFVGSMAFSASTYSQRAKIDLKFENSSLTEILNSIEKNSEFIFVYNANIVNSDLKRSISVKEGTIEEVLNILLQDVGVSYRIDDRQVFLYKNDELIKSAGIPETIISDQPQKKEISGLVKDSKGLPLPGVSVVVKGTPIGIVTDADGKFTLSVPADAKILAFSFVGMKSQEFPITGGTTFKVVLTEVTLDMDQVVVVAYGTQKKVNLTGAVSSINFEAMEMSSRPVLNTSSAITGLASGVYVNQNNGAPSNNTASIRIRGTGTLNQGSEALVIVDGNPGDMNIINPNDIASISILKDASSAAIYGSRASNGVILITTKSGSNTGKVVFDYNGYTGRIAPTKLFDIISDVGDHMELINLIQRNSGLSESFSQARIDEWRTKSKTDPIRYPNTNWYNEIIKSNILSSNTFSARGGNEKLNFYTSFGILDNSGLVPKSGLTRYNFRNSLNYKINDWLKLGQILTGNFSKHGPDLTQSLFIVYPNPSILPKNSDGRYGGAMSSGIDTQAGNLLQEIEQNKGESSMQDYTGKLFAILSPIKELDITGSYFIDTNNNNSWGSNVPSDRWNFQDETKTYDSSGAHTGVSNGFSKIKRQVLDLYTTYTKSFGKHNLKLLAGLNQEKYDLTYFSASKIDLISPDVPVLDAASNQPLASGSGEGYRMRSYFGRIGYDFSNKYLFEANIRYDGSSRFSPKNRWGAFPSFSAGWIASREGFWDPYLGTISFLKLRASYGKLGNNGIGNYAWQSVYGVYNYSFNGAIAQGLTPTALVNSNLKWETTDVLDFGADFELFNKLNVTIDYYNKFSHGILAQLPIPYVNGTLDPPYVNAAEVRNSGIEFNIRYNAKIGKLGISLGALGAYNKNKIEKYKGAGIIDNVGPNVGSWTEGQPIGIFYVNEVDHIIQNQKELDDLVAKGYTWDGQMPGVGDFLMKDADGNKIYNDADKVLKGNPIPLYTYAFNINLNYKGFDFYALSNGVAKVDKYLKGYSEGLSAMIGGYGYIKRWQSSWTPENKSTTIPRIYTNNGINNGDNDYFMSSGSYFRVKTLQLGYSLPQSLIKRAQLSKVRIYVNLENYFQITKYRGMDPEADGSVGMGSGSNETNTYPLMKTASIGLNIGF